MFHPTASLSLLSHFNRPSRVLNQPRPVLSELSLHAIGQRAWLIGCIDTEGTAPSEKGAVKD